MQRSSRAGEQAQDEGDATTDSDEEQTAEDENDGWNEQEMWEQTTRN